MELRHLRYFVVVAETCHFGNSAERLHIAQPALSQAIKQLELELNAPLLSRTTRKVTLTPAGEFLLGEARRILDTLDDTIAGVRRIASGQYGTVRIGLTGTAAYSHLPRIARLIRRELPGIAMQIHADLLTPDQCDMLGAGTLDLAILRPPVGGPAIESRVIATEPLILALPSEHPLAAEPIVRVGDLRAEPFVGYVSRQSAVNLATVKACHDAGFMPDLVHEAPGTSVLLALVGAGLGVALVPSAARALPLDGVTFRDITGVGSIELMLAWLRDRTNPVTDAVLAVLEADDLITHLSPEARS
ncbi:LysR substrate-binding domain-containing protein [Mycobacteroides immunogenum]|uniref:Probable hydrogen peroxide-inducible genes activator n=1 Tax=Mycobacteroides immunogenum TaxID=83262 RepID=A0A7V8RYI8_9MYCO|nr:LysR substrate-binding domain-containing protein [Mycobacteroides immunogenum]AMT73334.1 LysR family transcriptional regulator [Mycobacteroides immunogenum]ANO06496.1 LysR family transcriptional regulator [Mycobacteroides immunogenum]KIU39707.1 LysR family transcriptional regulator [Mycobacteroides immunogenum]KPG10728.1 LysR family transcriptional regulator [Mycobacteroides immunogenum]KPG12865.1 LysR family transcriptional regulator [Mycobacteroides immunogenum]